MIITFSNHTLGFIHVQMFNLILILNNNNNFHNRIPFYFTEYTMEVFINGRNEKEVVEAAETEQR